MTTRTFNDVDLAIRESGEGPPVVLLHGLGGTAAVWDHLVPLLVGRRTLAVDLRGHGESSWNGDYTVDALAKDVIALLETTGPADLVTHSLGGRIGLEVAMRRPELVRSIVLGEAAPARLEPTSVDIPDRPDEPTPFDWDVVAALKTEVRQVDHGWWDRLRQVRTRALWVLGGPTSQIPQDLIADAADAMPNAERVTIDGAGHDVHTATPDEFAAHVLAFLA